MTNIISILFLFIISNYSFANNIGSETGLDLPRYVSLKSNDSNVRVGPSKNYPITLKYIINDYPLKIVEEYDDWRKIVDFENNLGWIHKSLIKGERNGVIISSNNYNIKIYNTPSGKIIGEISKGIIIRLSKCKINWCLIIKDQHKGWIQKKYIWGVNKDEEFNINFFQIFFDYYIKSLNIIEDYISKYN